MKKLIFSIVLIISTFVSAEEWKTKIQLEKDVIEFSMETSMVRKHKTLDLWSSPVLLSKDNKVLELTSFVTGCQNLSGKIILVDESGKSMSGEKSVEWSHVGKDIGSVIASYTCAAAYKNDLVKKKEVI